MSGGHTQLIDVRAVGDYRRLGTTIDDAAGEAFDKTAKLLGLGQPGGPKVEAAARNGNPDRFDFPEPLKQRAGCDFSFSGLKTAVRLAALRLVDKDADHQPGNEDIADLAASFQFAAARHLAERTQKAMRTINEHYRNVDKDTGPRLVVAGGVAANSAIKGHLNDLCQAEGWRLMAPPAKYCTDNGAMIAQAGLERLGAANTASMYTHHGDPLAMAPRARWPLATVPAGAPAYGGGKKGPKA